LEALPALLPLSLPPPESLPHAVTASAKPTATTAGRRRLCTFIPSLRVREGTVPDAP
jgi:hypothetical protein